ncbi:MAG: hypothetical protein ACO1SV_15120 [Fimbriimonas sp.]
MPKYLKEFQDQVNAHAWNVAPVFTKSNRGTGVPPVPRRGIHFAVPLPHPNAQRALDLSRELNLTPSNLTRVGREVGDEAARWAFGQWELRRRARAKFARAESMLFVREALEQATHERVAAYHASLFPVGAPVVDMTAGIGADLIALAARGPVVGFELDPERAAYARHNLAAHGRTGEVRVGDSLAWLLPSPPAAGEQFQMGDASPGSVGTSAYAFADPARRVEGRRTLNLEEFAPDPRVVAEGFRKVALGVIKLSPMLRDDDLEALGVGLEFVSFGDECREALVLCGREAEPGRRAVHVESGERLAAEEYAPGTDAPAEFLFDADPAAVRAHALGTLAARFDLRGLGDSNGYLTGPEFHASPWLRTYRVLHHGKADAKSTKAALRALGAATPELKQRGAGLDLIRERKGYAMDGKRPVSLVIWPLGRSLRHTIVEAILTNP